MEIKHKNEIWKNISNYEGLYQASNFGRIRSVKNNIIMKLSNHRDGYYKIKLCKNGVSKYYRVHRLIAETFIPNPNNYPCVNHKDENKQNNNVNNLEFCTHSYNNSYGTRLKRVSASNKTRKPVLKFDLKGNFLEKYNSVIEATRKNNIGSPASVSDCCNKKIKQTNGNIYRFESEVPICR